jgi:gamma-glutamyltranspeptidase/glutathione hydrolase
LEEFAAEGPRFVTEGEIAQALMALTDEGGHLTPTDLKTYSPIWRQPLSTDFMGAKLALNPPPALGGTLVALPLNLVEQKPAIDEVVRAFEATATARITAGLDGDPETGAARLLSNDMLRQLRGSLQARATRGTTHISVIDSEGTGAALTLSNGEGCGLIAPGTGIMPNNMLGEADLLPNGLDSWRPDQRMSSMMCPMVIDWPDGRFAMLGSGGSNRIRTALAQVTINLVDRDMALTDAIDAPRCHVEAGSPLEVDFEDVGGEAVRDRILSAYPDARPWEDVSMFFGGVHAAMAGPRGVVAAGDPRRAGSCVIG